MERKTPFFLIGLLLLLAFIFNNFDYLLYPYHLVKDFLYYPVNALKKDNELIISNNLKDSIITGLKEDIENLLKINNMTKSLNNFDYVNATIISRNREYWFNNLIINKGKNNGIDVDMAVIDMNGLIGRVSSVTNNTAVVKLITTNDINNKVSAEIINNKEKIYGIINGYDSKNNYLHMIITDDKEIVKNSKVETTGMGGVFPSNILIGYATDVIKDSDGITNIVRIKPSSNIEGGRYVAVLKRYEISNS